MYKRPETPDVFTSCDTEICHLVGTQVRKNQPGSKIGPVSTDFTLQRHTARYQCSLQRTGTVRDCQGPSHLRFGALRWVVPPSGSVRGLTYICERPGKVSSGAVCVRHDAARLRKTRVRETRRGQWLQWWVLSNLWFERLSVADSFSGGGSAALLLRLTTLSLPQSPL